MEALVGASWAPEKAQGPYDFLEDRLTTSASPMKKATLFTLKLKMKPLLLERGLEWSDAEPVLEESFSDLDVHVGLLERG